MGPTRSTLADGRLHFLHGPIELLIDAQGPAVAAAHERAWLRFQSILQELVLELPELRRAVRAGQPCTLQGPVARRMWQACAAQPVEFITPMAAVAGAVAEEVLKAYQVHGIIRASVNNGGDIALHLCPGSRFEVGIVADIHNPDPRAVGRPDGRFSVLYADPVRGVATSGWAGRSHSMGIADAVTILARSAAMADAAATVVANAVNAEEASIVRAPACELREDSDLGSRLVTVSVPALNPSTVQAALRRGAAVARRLQQSGLLHAAVLLCQGQHLVVAPIGHEARVPELTP